MSSAYDLQGDRVLAFMCIGAVSSDVNNGFGGHNDVDFYFPFFFFFRPHELERSVSSKGLQAVRFAALWQPFHVRVYTSEFGAVEERYVRKMEAEKRSYVGNIASTFLCPPPFAARRPLRSRISLAHIRHTNGAEIISFCPKESLVIRLIRFDGNQK